MMKCAPMSVTARLRSVQRYSWNPRVSILAAWDTRLYIDARRVLPAFVRRTLLHCPPEAVAPLGRALSLLDWPPPQVLPGFSRPNQSVLTPSLHIARLWSRVVNYFRPRFQLV